jgi:hypothetical protein
LTTGEPTCAPLRRERTATTRRLRRSAIKGVSWKKHAGRWEAKLSLGLFDTTDEAAGVVEAVREFRANT